MIRPIKIPDSIIADKGVDPDRNSTLRVLLAMKGIDCKRIFPTIDVYDFERKHYCTSNEINQMNARKDSIFICADPNETMANFIFTTVQAFYRKFIRGETS